MDDKVITLRGLGSTGAVSNPTMMFGGLLLTAAAGVGAYFLWKRMQEKKEEISGLEYNPKTVMYFGDQNEQFMNRWWARQHELHAQRNTRYED